MLKKAGFYISVTTIVLLCIYSIYLMYQTDTRYDVSIDSSEIVVSNSDDEIYLIKTGDVIKTINLRGTVAPLYDTERIEVYVEGVSAKIEKCVEAGDILDENSVYAKCNGYEYKTDSKWRCVSVETKANGVVFVFIDYSKLYIDVNIPEEYAKESLYEKEVEVKNNETEFSGDISYIDVYCSGGMVNSRVTYNSKEILLRPGTECSVSIVLSQKEDVVVVPLEYVIYSKYEDEYRVMLVEGNKTITTKVKIGIIGDEVVEVISGVNENDCIMLPSTEMSLDYYLSNSKEG